MITHETRITAYSALAVAVPVLPSLAPLAHTLWMIGVAVVLLRTPARVEPLLRTA
jgi:hypothetical protein